MKKSQLLFRILLYLSLPFVIWYLLKTDLLQFKTLDLNINLFILSFVFLFLGFILSALSWQYALKLHGNFISKKKAIVSHGLSVFAKYIPGKIWVILGRASAVSNKEHDLSFNSFVSLKEQLIYLMVGFLISLPGSFIVFKHDIYKWITPIIICILFFVLYVKKIQNFIGVIANRLLKGEFNLPTLNVKESLHLSSFVLIYWIVWIVAFYMLLLSAFDYLNISLAFAFPASICYGLLAIFVPGGIGIREGIISAYLVNANITINEAVTFTILARVWFMIGEVFMFIVALISNSITKK